MNTPTPALVAIICSAEAMPESPNRTMMATASQKNSLMIEGVTKRSHWNRSRKLSMKVLLSPDDGVRKPSNETEQSCPNSRRYCGRHMLPVDAPRATVFNGSANLERAQSVPQLHWEDFTPGRVFEHGPRRLTREEIVAFAAEFDPQPMHLDEDAARATMLGGLARLGLARLLHPDADVHRRLRAQFELRWARPASTRCAGCCRSGPATSLIAARHRAGNARLQEPARHGLRALRVRTAQRRRRSA